MVTAQAREPLLLDRAQQLRLQCRRKRGDVVEVDGAAGRGLELSELPRLRVSERAFLVAEQLRLEQLCRNCGAVDLDERLAAAIAARVDGLGEKIFAAAGLAEEKEIDIVVEYFLDRLQERSHRGAPRADEILQDR